MRAALKISLILVAALGFACAGERAQPVTTSEPAATAEPAKRSFEQDLEYIQISDFAIVYVLRRKDGQAINGEDGNFIRGNSPLETNRRVMADEGNAVIIGTNFRFSDEQLGQLKKRFDFQDLSPVKEQNANSGGDGNSGNKPAK